MKLLPEPLPTGIIGDWDFKNNDSEFWEEATGEGMLYPTFD